MTILLGLGSGLLLLGGMGVLSVALVATMLAPTDAALGKAVVTNPRVPSKLRESLTVESGLNDGVCVAILFIFLALVTETVVSGGRMALAIGLVSKAIGIGLIVGLGVTYIGTQLLRRSNVRHIIDQNWGQLPVVAVSILTFGLAQWLGGSGFIASFILNSAVKTTETPKLPENQRAVSIRSVAILAMQLARINYSLSASKH